MTEKTAGCEARENVRVLLNAEVADDQKTSVSFEAQSWEAIHALQKLASGRKARLAQAMDLIEKSQEFISDDSLLYSEAAKVEWTKRRDRWLLAMKGQQDYCKWVEENVPVFLQGQWDSVTLNVRGERFDDGFVEMVTFDVLGACVADEPKEHSL